MTRAEVIRARIKKDFQSTLHQWGVDMFDECLNELLDDAMFAVEHLLAELEGRDADG